MTINRRDWMIAAGAALASTAARAQHPATKIGVELGCVGANQWTPYQFLDYFHKVGIGMAQFSSGTLGIRGNSKPDEAELRKIRAYAQNLGISLSAFSGRSICPTSSGFDARLGTAEDQIQQGLGIARIIGAKCMRVVLGSYKERPEIARHLESMTRVLKGMRGRIKDSGVRLALENHNADLQAREIKALIEDVGPDILGVCLDSGNPLVTMEDPHLTLELLGPYAATTHIRDTAVWRVPEGVAVRWVNMGEGNVDIDGWVKKFVAMHPELPVSFENLPMAEPRILRVFDPQTFKDFPKMPAADLSRYLALAERGKPPAARVTDPGKSRGQQQCEDLEVCIKYVRHLLS
jgi:sugar phosphate isomerase/epimerase